MATDLLLIECRIDEANSTLDPQWMTATAQGTGDRSEGMQDNLTAGSKIWRMTCRVGLGGMWMKKRKRRWFVKYGPNQRPTKRI